MIDRLGRKWGRIYTVIMYINPQMMPELHKSALFSPDVRRDMAKYDGTWNTLITCDTRDGESLFVQWGNAVGFDEPVARILYQRPSEA